MNNRPKVLIISYYAPPQNVPGALRVGKLLKYLPAAGWDALVLTVPQNDYFGNDPQLYRDVPMHIVRSGSFDIFTLQRWMRKYRTRAEHDSVKAITTQREGLVARLKKWMPIDDKLGWLPSALFTALQLHRAHHFDCVFTTLGGVFHTGCTARLFSRITGVPYVVEFRDLFSGNALNAQSRLTRCINRHVEKKIIRDAAAVIGVSPATTRALQLHDAAHSDRFFTITNGFDSDDFTLTPRAPQSRLIMTFCGSLYTSLVPEQLFESLLKLGKRYPVTIRFIGTVRGRAAQQIEHYAAHLKELDVAVEVLPKVPYAQMVDAMAESDLLLVFVPDDHPQAEGILTTKIFDYIGAQRPVLAFCPAGGDLMQLVQQGSLGWAVPYSQIASGAEALASIFTQHQSGALASHRFMQGFRNKFDRNVIARKVATILDKARTGAE
jgi:glycosyltransferase involved in cell wall biosynthesis